MLDIFCQDRCFCKPTMQTSTRFGNSLRGLCPALPSAFFASAWSNMCLTFFVRTDAFSNQQCRQALDSAIHCGGFVLLCHLVFSIGLVKYVLDIFCQDRCFFKPTMQTSTRFGNSLRWLCHALPSGFFHRLGQICA